MAGTGLTFLIGALSLAGGIATGYSMLQLARRRAQAPASSFFACLPMLAGVITGSLAMALFMSRLLAPHDRFYSEFDALRILLAVNLSGLALFSVYFLPHSSVVRQKFVLRWILRLLIELIACGVVIAAGVRFNVLSPIPGKEVALDSWAWLATLVWMLVAMNTVKMLDGIEGAASVVLLVGAVAVFYTTLGTQEYFLHTFALVLAGASLASLRFTAYPARWSLRGAGSSVAGFLFAVLTVLARQKTVAALLFIFPLALVLIVLGGAVLGSLERVLFPDRDRP